MAAPPTQPGAEAEVVDSPTPILRLANDILADIFLRLPALADVGRTATACPAFRRVVADPSFKRRLRRAHRAPLLGFLFCRFHPAEAPHSSAPFARALERAADLCFSYLHSPQPFTRWYPLDARDGRVVLGHTSSTSFVVADPLSRRCLLLPPIPVLAAAPQHPFLFPAMGDEAETSFTVGCMAEGEPGLMLAFVYSSATGEWSDLHMVTTLSEPKPSYACGSFYWKFTADTLLVLDARAMEFSFVEIPTTYGERDFVVAEAGEGRTGIFSIRPGDGWAPSSLICAIKRSAGEGAAGVEWQYKRRIALPPQYRYSFAGASDRHLLLHRAPWNLRATTSGGNSDSGSAYFSVESDTLKIEKVCGLGQLLDAVPYVGFPPSLCLPSI
ncbi:hypothetical protein SEVIR_2G360400v4 [Setaria viridis]|uniref:uncharacterized protein n=1 Tax=Setaria viridis TaxID=4556 RepID=UPI003B3AA819